MFAHQFVRRARSLQNKGRVLLVSGLGGAFGRGASAGAELRIAGGGPALAKTLYEEWPEVVAKAIDLPRDRSARELAALLFAELAVPGGRMEVGYPNGQRTIFRTEAAAIDITCAPRDALPDGAVILVTGGARGITAEVLHPLARPGVTLVLAGRTPLPGPEDATLVELKTEAALRTHLISQSARRRRDAATTRHRTERASDPAQPRDQRQYRGAARGRCRGLLSASRTCAIRPRPLR